MSRAPATGQTASAIGQLQALAHGGFTDRTGQLEPRCRILPDPGERDKDPAARFRDGH